MTTVRGERCRQDVSITIEVAAARRGAVTLWTERHLVEPAASRHRRPWTDEDDALVADPSVPTSEAAARPGRTVATVQIRRSLKPRGLVKMSGVESCEAMTARGKPCRHPAAYTVDLEGAPRRLCAAHVLAARRGTASIWREWPPAEPSTGGHRRPWTAEEDALLDDVDVPTSEVAARTGRTVGAVTLRRSYKRRGLV